MAWLSDNSDWIFSGAGILLFGYLVAMLDKAYIRIKSKIVFVQYTVVRIQNSVEKANTVPTVN